MFAEVTDMNYVLGAFVGLLWGAAGAWLNGLITKRAVEKGTQKAMMTMNFGHMAVDIAALGIIFLLRKALPFSFEAALIATAVALSIGTILFTYSESKKNR